MRYHYEKPTIYLSMYGERYICEHPVYNSCTLFKIGEKDWLLFSSVLTPRLRVPGGARWIRGLQMIYIYIRSSKNTLKTEQAIVWMDFIQRLQ